MVKNALAFKAPPWYQLGSLQRFPDTLAEGRGADGMEEQRRRSKGKEERKRGKGKEDRTPAFNF